MSAWVDLAIEAADAYGVPRDIFLATIEAETNGRNVVGDGGQATGFGQVWLKWHTPKLVDAARKLGIALPANADHKTLQEIMLADDRLSMYTAAAVAKGFWSVSGGDFVTFTKKYVGPAVPEAEIARRLRLLESWRSKLGPGEAKQTWSWPSGTIIRESETRYVIELGKGLAAGGIVLLAFILLGIGFVNFILKEA